MLYRQFKDKKLSWLGYGAMRMPVTAERGPIDEEKARALIEYAYENGVNYFDTAYRYHDGASEPFVGSVLSQYPRDSWYLASKFPGHMMQYENGKIVGAGYLTNETITSVESIFEDQLKRCAVDYFDFYMIHNICETSFNFYTNEEVAVVKYFKEQQKAGRIKHLGVSAHGRAETIDKFLKHYPNTFEFGMIQLNYLDWTLQDADKKYEALTKHGLAVMSMESIRGGALVKLKDEAEALLKAARPNDSIASWAFRFLQSLPELVVATSGMTTMEQLKENIAIFSQNDPTTKIEQEILRRVVDKLGDVTPCTTCGYCLEACPIGLDIPKLISIADELKFGHDAFVTKYFTLRAMKEEELPAACTACGACNPLCPQGIDIPAALKQFAEAIKE